MLQPLTYKIEVGVLAGILIYYCLLLFTLRFTLYIPPIWQALPECMKKFVANQSLDKSQMKKLEELGYKVPTKDTEMASS